MAQAINIRFQRSLNNIPTTLLYGEPAWDDANQSFFIGDSSGSPVLINNIIALGPVIGQVPRWDGSKYVNSNLLNTGRDGCSLLTIDDTGLDWCNYQVGNNGSAFQTLKKSRGTIETPIALVSGDKIGGIGFIGFDEATFNPGYVGAEISSFVTEDQNATSGGAELRFSITPNGSKNPVTSLVLESDGTLTVGNQSAYENKVLSPNDIPNKEYVDNAIVNNVSTSIGDLVDVDLTEAPAQQPGNFLKWNPVINSYIPTLLREGTNGGLITDATNYEELVVNDDNIPNKKYVDDLFGGLTGASDMSTIQLRKTVTHNITNGAFNSVSFDIADVESNTSVLEQDNNNPSRILIKETGIYFITYDLHSDGNGTNKTFRILLNGSNVLEGSQSVRNDSTDTNKSSVGVALFTNFVAGDFVELQTQANGPNAVLDPPTVFGVVRLKGSKGDRGDSGSDGASGQDGEPGPAGYGIFAWSETQADTNQLESNNLTVVANGTGIYDYSFTNQAPSANYNVFVQPVYNGTFLNTVEVEVYNKATTGFTIRLNQQDDGGAVGTNLNFRHSVSVLGVGGGLPSGSVLKGSAPDNEFVFFNGSTLNSNNSISYDTTINNINIESQNTGASALNINTSTADSDWLSFTYLSNYVGGFFGAADDSGELGLILGDVGQINTVAYQGIINTAVGYQIAGQPLSLPNLGDVSNTLGSAASGDILIKQGTEWTQRTPPVPMLNPGFIRVVSQGSDQSVNYNVTTPIPISLTGGALNVGAGSNYFTNNNGSITCNFDGVVRANYSIPHFSNVARAHLKTVLQKNGVNYSPASYSYIRVGNGERRDINLCTDLVSVNTGDVLRIVASRGEQSTRTGDITLEANCTFILERIQ